jgi:hypothetical protein
MIPRTDGGAARADRVEDRPRMRPWRMNRAYATRRAQPIITFEYPAVIAPPCNVVSPCRIAALPPNVTLSEPFCTLSIDGATQTHVSPLAAAG